MNRKLRLCAPAGVAALAGAILTFALLPPTGGATVTNVCDPTATLCVGGGYANAGPSCDASDGEDAGHAAGAAATVTSGSTSFTSGAFVYCSDQGEYSNSAVHVFALGYENEAQSGPRVILFWHGQSVSGEESCTTYVDVGGLGVVPDSLTELGCAAGSPPYVVPTLPDL